ncbi:MAG: phosphomannomutase/phosphoglucomutase [Proteobacteria bacterium]|nr:phosphomannomutase/phosphoglucomutase [Pseudomonadota bacterium]
MKHAPQPHRLDPEILREYDIRGRIGKNLSEEDARAVGLAFGTMVRRKSGRRVCAGYDGRKTSPAFAQAVIAGLNAAGIDVENIGLGPTPMLWFAVKHADADGGIMITGSHNPPDYNGFKMTLKNETVFGPKIQELGRITAAADYESGSGNAKQTDVSDAYIARLLKDLDCRKPLKIAWDCGNGAAGDIVRRLTAKLPGDHILLFDEIDGSFPNHHPDPTVDKNLADLIRAVKEKDCHFGVAFDGDGDRIGAVDEKGSILRCDLLLALYAREVLQKHPGAAVIADVKCSQVLFDEIARLGGKPVMWKTGHSLIKTKMAELEAPLAGELSGHIFFADGYYGFDDGLYAAIRLMNEAGAASGPLSSLTEHMARLFNTPEIRFEVEEKEKFAIVQRIAKSIKSLENKHMTVDDTDGMRVRMPYGWWLLRASNTQNVLVARAEADSPEHLDGIKETIIEEVAKAGYDIDFSG